MHVKTLFGDGCEGSEAENPGIVDQNVQSTEGGIDFFVQPRNICGLGHVAPDCDRLAAAVTDRLNDAFRALPVGEMIHGHARACSGQGRCNPAAYAFRRARNYRHFLRKSAHRFTIAGDGTLRRHAAS